MKDFIFTVSGEDIYLCETPKKAKELYGRSLHFMHHRGGKNYYFTLNRSEKLLWQNLLFIDLEIIEDQHNFLEGLSQLWPYLSEINESEKVYPLDKITFFGGSFNPWHDGHSICVKRVKQQSPLLIMPDKNPFKEVSSTINPFTEYIKLALKLKAEINLGSKWIFPGFMLLEDGNPTYRWVKKLKINYPKIEVSLAMGFDSAKDIKDWINSEELLKRLNGIYILSRKETEDHRFALKASLKAINPDLEIHFLGHHKYEDISSTKIRTK